MARVINSEARRFVLRGCLHLGQAGAVNGEGLLPASYRPAVPRIFLLSPASCGGLRARMLLRPQAQFELAQRLRRPEGVPIGEVFTFLSGLYFRGKVAYATRFATPPAGLPGAWVITTRSGLVPLETPTTAAQLRRFEEVDIHLEEPRYTTPLKRTARALFQQLGPACEVVLLGSVASGKYLELLQPIFGERLLFPPTFVGRGDMSRGGVMLRAAKSGLELEYGPVAGAVLRGKRPPRLPRAS